MPQKLILLTVFFLSPFFLFAQSSEKQKAEDCLSEYGEVNIKIPYQTTINLRELSRQLSITNVDEKWIYANANQREFELFLQKKLDYAVIKPKKIRTKLLKNRTLGDVMNWDVYPTYDEYLQLMQKFEDDYPQLCQLVEIGESEQGRKLLALKISDNVQQKEAEPEFFYSSTMHGDELVGYMLMLRLAHHLLSSYGTDPRLTMLVQNIEIWINPNANPDGTYHGGNNTVFNSVRRNANGYDLNRNFPDPWLGLTPNGPWQAETRAMMDFMGQHNFVLSANLHSGIEVANYPWDGIYSKHDDENWFIYVCRQYADTAQKYSYNGYFTSRNNGITNGADWYTIEGGRQDYMAYYLSGREVTLELDYTMNTPESELHAHWDYNVRSLLNYMEQCLFGIRGITTDTDGNPLRAKIEILSHEPADSTRIYSEKTHGNYHRLIEQGNHDLLFTYEGDTVKVFGVPVKYQETRYLDIIIPSNGIAGRVLFDRTKLPVQAKVEILDGESTVATFQSGEKGDYEAIAAPGKYDVRFSAAGFDTLCIKNIDIKNREYNIYDIEMTSTNHAPVVVDEYGSAIDTVFVIAESNHFDVFLHAIDIDEDNIEIDTVYSLNQTGTAAIGTTGELYFSYSVDMPENEFDTLKVIIKDNAQATLYDTAFVVINLNVLVGMKIQKNQTALMEVYPNPVKNQMTVDFVLPKPAFVTLEMYDVSGKRIKQLSSINYTFGRKKIEINTSALPEGLYFCRLKAQNRILFRKVVIVR